MWELLAQIAFTFLDNIGHARGRFSGRILLVMMLAISIGCAFLTS